MGDVIELGKRRPGRWLEGEMVCTGCKHVWHGVCPVGLVSGFECPNCGGGKGIHRFPVIPNEIWVCQCSGDLFHLTKHGARCRECGEVAVGWEG